MIILNFNSQSALITAASLNRFSYFSSLKETLVFHIFHIHFYVHFSNITVCQKLRPEMHKEVFIESQFRDHFDLFWVFWLFVRFFCLEFCNLEVQSRASDALKLFKICYIPINAINFHIQNSFFFFFLLAQCSADITDQFYLLSFTMEIN